MIITKTLVDGDWISAPQYSAIECLVTMTRNMTNRMNCQCRVYVDGMYIKDNEVIGVACLEAAGFDYGAS